MGELRRRHVYRAVGAYIISAWFVVQMADVVLPALFVPAWVVSLLVVLAILGLPVAGLLAWAYDITPEGVVRSGRLRAEASSGRASFSWTGRWIDYVIICGLLGILGWILMTSDSVTDSGRHDTPSIAVLPFSDLSPEQDSAYFSDGIAEAIMDSLAVVPTLQVTARTSSFAYRQAGTDVREVARLLGVDNLLEGSVRRVGNQVRISTRLVDGRSGHHLWSETYEARLDDIFAVQDSISRAVAEVLEVRLTGNGAIERPTRDQIAYDHYLRGRAFLREEPTSDSLAQAIEQFRLALGRDPAFGLAHAGLCTAHWEQYEDTFEVHHVERARATCERARLQNPMRAETQIALSRIHLGTGQFEKALAAMQSALRVDPDNSQAHVGMGLVKEQLGALDEAEAHFLQAIELDPAWWRNYSYLGGFYMETAGNFAAAAEQYEQAIRLEPDSALSHNNLGGALLYQGEFGRAAEAFHEAIKRQHEPSPTTYANAGTSYFLEGRLAEAEVMFRVATELTATDFRPWAFLAAIVRLQGDREAEADRHDRKAVETARQRLEVNPADDDARAVLVQALARLGRVDEAAAERARLGPLEQLGHHAHRTMALAALALGDQAAARDHYNAAADAGAPMVLLSHDPRLSDLARDPNSRSE